MSASSLRRRTGTAIGGPLGAAIFGGICLANAGTGVYYAGLAQNSVPKKCVQATFITLAVTSPVIVWATYSGGYCK